MKTLAQHYLATADAITLRQLEAGAKVNGMTMEQMAAAGLLQKHHRPTAETLPVLSDKAAALLALDRIAALEYDIMETSSTHAHRLGERITAAILA